LPQAYDFFGRDSLGSPEVFAANSQSRRWTVLGGIDDPVVLQCILIMWAASAFMLLLGGFPHLGAAAAWLLSISFIGLNGYLHNSGDNVRTTALFYLILSPCAAVWSVRSNRVSDCSEVYIPSWPIRLLALQLTIIYFVNGLYKLSGFEWRNGQIMHEILGNLSWTRFSYAQLPLSEFAMRLMTWSTLIFELAFPLLFFARPTRIPALVVGACFHLGTAAFLRLGPFPFYMMCLYLPFLPWERLRRSIPRH
jgi:hypothetical protein